MKVKDRLQKLHNEKYVVKHKAIGYMNLEDNFDLIRVRGVKEGKPVKDYCEFLYAERLIKNETYQKFSNDILNKEIIHEEVWMLGGECALDMFVNI